MEEQLATAVPDLATSKLVSVLLHCQVLHVRPVPILLWHAELAAGLPLRQVPLLLPHAELPAGDQTGEQLPI